jgi:hypothetical protein
LKQAGCLLLIIVAVILYFAFNTAIRQSALIEKKQEETEYIQKLTVLKTKWVIDDYGYSRISFSVKNNGTQTTKYVKITAQFFDKKGNIIDSTYTNTLEKIPPDAAKIFEIMHKTPKEAKKITVFVEEVVLNK